MRTLSALLFILSLVSCAPKRYVYDIKMERPKESTILEYENDTFSLAFTFKPDMINIRLYNKSEEGIKIVWDEVSMSENGQAQRVVHNETGTFKITEVQPPTTVPPRTYLDDNFITTNSVRYTYSGGTKRALFGSMFPTSDNGSKKERERIMKKKNQRITVFFPYYIRNIYNSKTFDFRITDIRLKKK